MAARGSRTVRKIGSAISELDVAKAVKLRVAGTLRVPSSGDDVELLTTTT
jgi:hypothetical protein